MPANCGSASRRRLGENRESGMMRNKAGLSTLIWAKAARLVRAPSLPKLAFATHFHAARGRMQRPAIDLRFSL